MIVKAISCHHPLRPVSCNLRAPTAKPGNKNMRSAKWSSVRVRSSRLATTEMIAVKRVNHQNSGRDALPSNVKYLCKQVEIALPNVIGGLIYPLME